MRPQKFRGRWLSYILIWILLLTAAPASSPATSGQAQEQKEEAALFNTQGLELSKSGRFEGAVKAFKQAIKLKPDYAEAHYNLGDAYAQLHEFKKAIDEYKQAISYKPDLTMAYNNMGTAHYKLGEHKLAIAAYKEAIRLDPKRAMTHFNVGAAYLESGDKQAALEQYNTLKAIDPSLAEKLYLSIYKPTATVFDPGGANSVRLNVTVTDPQGAPVRDLKQEDFRVSEDGIPRAISSFSIKETPLAYGLLVDNSGSFRNTLGLAVETARAIAASNTAADETFLIRFIDSQKIETVVNFTSDKGAIDAALDKLYVEGGQSAIKDAVYLAAKFTAQYKAKDAPYRRRALILLTDGEDRDSYYTMDKLLETLRKLDVQVYAICLTRESEGGSKLNRNLPPRSSDFLLKLAKETGGQAFFPKSTSGLPTIVSQVSAILRNQYVIEYKSAGPAPGQPYRTVRVEVVGPPERSKSLVTTRAGYLIPELTPTP
jgi:Ca-activated chloride channel family protein